MSHSINYFFQNTLINNFSIIRYLKTFEMRTSGPYDKHYIVWGSHFRYHGGISFPNGGYVNTCICCDQQWKWVLAGAAEAVKSKRRVKSMVICKKVVSKGWCKEKSFPGYLVFSHLTCLRPIHFPYLASVHNFPSHLK